MRLSCPGCQTEYEVPDAALAGRVRTLRCAHCSHQWEYGPLPMALAEPDPVGAAWPGAAPRGAFADIPATAPPETRPASVYEPLNPPPRDSWPPLPGNEPTANQFYEPIASLSASQLAAENSADNTYESPTAETAPLPTGGPETQTRPASGNEERFAALVRTSRNEPEFIEPRPHIRAGLFTTIILLIGIGAGIWAARFHIMAAWPPSTRLFDAINNLIAAHH